MRSPLRPLRRRAGQALRNTSALRELRTAVERRASATETRVEATDLRVGKYAARTDKLHELIAAQAKQIAELRGVTGELRTQIQKVQKSDGLREIDHRRMAVQVAAIEERVGRFEQRLGDAALVSDDAGLAEGRTVLDEVRREHEQIRTRMQIISWYEERLRRAETSLASVYEGDTRHPL